MKFRIYLNPKISETSWVNFIKHRPDATVFHLPSWQRVLIKSFNYKPLYFFALDEQKNILGILPLFEIKSVINGNRLISSPLSYICGPIAKNETVEQELVKKAKILSKTQRSDYLEIRSLNAKKFNLKLDQYFSTCRLELSPELETVWKKLDKGSARWAITKAKKEGVEIVRSHSFEDLKIFNRLNQVTKRNLGVPAHPLSFFENIFRELPDNCDLYFAKIDNKIIAGMFNLKFKDTIIHGYGASDRKYLKYHPNNLLVWQAIEDGCKASFKWFDFGRAGQDNQELLNFKKRWGGIEQKLHYYYFPQKPQALTINRASLKFRIINNIWKKLPVWLSQNISNIIFKQFD